MPDISMCLNEQCSRKRECYRCMAEPKPTWQSYQSFNHESCDSFKPMDDRANTVTSKA